MTETLNFKIELQNSRKGNLNSKVLSHFESFNKYIKGYPKMPTLGLKLNLVGGQTIDEKKLC